MSRTACHVIVGDVIWVGVTWQGGSPEVTWGQRSSGCAANRDVSMWWAGERKRRGNTWRAEPNPLTQHTIRESRHRPTSSLYGTIKEDISAFSNLVNTPFSQTFGAKKDPFRPNTPNFRLSLLAKLRPSSGVYKLGIGVIILWFHDDIHPPPIWYTSSSYTCFCTLITTCILLQFRTGSMVVTSNHL